jgi:uncharacterized membrane protein
VSALVKILHLLAVSIWVGSVAFFSFIVAPAIFRTLPRHQAGDVVGAIFPTYYWVGHLCGALALGTLILAARSDGWSAKAAAVGVFLVVMLGANIYAGFVVQPKVVQVKAEIREATSGGEVPPPLEMKEKFDRLHKLSVQLNGVVLVGGILVLIMSSVGLRL